MAEDAASTDTIRTTEELAATPEGTVVRSAAGTIAARFDTTNGTLFGDDRPFPWAALDLPCQVLYRPTDDEIAELRARARPDPAGASTMARSSPSPSLQHPRDSGADSPLRRAAPARRRLMPWARPMVTWDSKGRRQAVAPKEELLPETTPATPDLICWLWAAVESRTVTDPETGDQEQRLNISAIARAFKVSRTTVRRWIAHADDDVRQVTSVAMQEAMLSRPVEAQAASLARQRGKGRYLWPSPDPVTARRAEARAYRATRDAQMLANHPDRAPEAWSKTGVLLPHEVLLCYWPHADAWTIAVTHNDKIPHRIRRFGGEIVSSVSRPNRWASEALKFDIFDIIAEHRAITPRALIPLGHTDAWRDDPAQREQFRRLLQSGP